MCARYTLRVAGSELVQLFWLSEELPFEPRYNIAPTQPVVTITQDSGEMQARWMRWGLVPGWSKGPGTGPLMINARSETLRDKPAFRQLVKRKRCLLPADGFLEWRTEKGAKQPYLAEVDGGNVFAFAGLYDVWMGDTDSYLESCTLLTTEPNALMGTVHDRMPVIVSPDRFLEWLDYDQPVEAFNEPFAEKRMRLTAVNPKVGNSRLEGPELLTPVNSAASD